MMGQESMRRALQEHRAEFAETPRTVTSAWSASLSSTPSKVMVRPEFGEQTKEVR
jgi:hypothetical protein